MNVWTALIAVYIIWGSTYLAIRFAIESIPPFFMASFRFLAAGAIFFIWEMLTSSERPTLKQWRSGFVVGGLLLVGGNGLVVFSEQHIPSGIAALVVSTVPLWMVLLEALRPGGVRPTPRVGLGIIGGFVGVVLLLNPAHLSDSVAGHLKGFVLLLIASFSWAVGSLYSKRAPLPASHRLSTAIEMLGGGILLFVTGLCLGENAAWRWTDVSLRSALSLGYLIVFGALIGFTAYTWLLKNASVALTSTYAYVNPIVAIFLGWLFAGEPVTKRTLMASALVVASVALVSGQRRH